MSDFPIIRHACERCGEPAVFLTTDDVWLCEGHASHLIELDRREREQMDYEQYLYTVST